jgi:hypothetical protein
MISLHDGNLHLQSANLHAVLSLQFWRDSAWHPVPLSGSGNNFSGAQHGISAKLDLGGDDMQWLDYELSLTSEFPTRIRLNLQLPEIEQPFHLIPGNIFGDNNLKRAEPGHYPNLTMEHPESTSCSPYWEMRADRASHPVSLICFAGGIAAVAINPYSDGKVVPANRDGFIRNGVFAQLAHDGEPNACGVTLGYRNAPVTFLNKDQWLDATEHATTKATARGAICLAPATSRRDAHRVIQRVYERYRETPATPLSSRESIVALTDAFLNVNWQPERENFSNMRCIDPEKKTLTAWRTLAEVGWTGGGVIGYPLLIAGHLLNDSTALERARYMLHWVAQAYNPASGLLWDVCGKHEGKQVNWWWSGYVVQDCHAAYTNGSGLYYLLKSYEFARATLGEDHPEWLDTALKALNTIVSLQEPSGNFGFTYSTERPEIIDPEGFAGVWFVPALTLAYRATGEQRYLDAAQRGIEFYHGFVRELSCWGTPLDTWKSVDQEGNLGFMRGATLLHQTTGEQRYLAMLEDSAHYEYLWRYGFAARAEYPPLKGSHWGSCGGSITSVSNPHIHPMGIFISRDLQYLAEQTGSDYHRNRFEDGINFGINIVSLYPEVAGYGQRGVLTERFCPSDGLTIEEFPDGAPSSLWFSYNGWAAAAVLEGLVESVG